jgi:hypothetical protein
MGTKVSEIMDMMLARIPAEFKSDVQDDYELAVQGMVEMGIALNDEYVFTGDGKDQCIDIDLTMAKKWLASRFAYRCYLERLWDSLNQAGINFKTLTFEIKSLEKRPESIQEELYKLNRYLDSEIARATGANSVVGYVSQFGSES